MLWTAHQTKLPTFLEGTPDPPGIASQHEPRVRETLERLAPDEEGHGWHLGLHLKDQG